MLGPKQCVISPEIPIDIWIAGEAPTALKSQSQSLAAAVDGCNLRAFPGDHFAVMEALRDPQSAILRRLLA